MFIKTSHLLCCALLLTAALVSCGQEHDDSKETVTDSQTTAAVSDAESDTSSIYHPNLPEANYNGETFMILNSNDDTWRMATSVLSSDESAGDSLNDAIHQRNLEVMEKYNIVLEEYLNEDGDEIARTAISSGDDTYDLLLIHRKDLLDLVLINAVTDWAEIPYIETDKEWWVQGSMQELSIGGKVYFGISMFDTSHFDSVYTYYFNKSLITEYDLSDPYELVLSGQWTFDRLYEMGMAVAKDMNGDSKWDEGDRYGISSHAGMFVQAMMGGADAMLTLSKDENDLPVFTLNSEYYITRLQKLYDMLYTADGFVNPFAESSNHGGVDYFMSGNSLFFCETMGNAAQLRSMTLDFGILPAPKYDEAQTEYYNDGGSPYFMMVPTTNQDLDRTGLLMEALAYASMDTVKVAMYDDLLEGKVSRDVESEQMLNILYSSLSYKIPIAGDIIADDLSEYLYLKKKNDFASWFAKKETSIQRQINNAITAYTENN